ncbi:MAG TPA: CHAT domain-containing protein [Candidatus Acidoferrales bacterium]|nr:CHAT domain-containing protein [Candidatus Acidoferrales bacterium]
MNKREVPTAEEDSLQELARLSTEAQRKEFLARHPELLRPEVVSRLSEEVHAQIRINATLALSLAEAALAVARRMGQEESLSRSLRTMANALYANGKNKEAIESYDEAFKAFEAQGNDLEVAITLSSCLQPHILLGEYDHAFLCADRARTIFTGLGEKRRLARLEINVGNILHRQDRFEEALSCYQRSHESLSSTQDKEAIAAVLSNLAVCLTALNDFPRALEAYQKAREFCKQHGMAILTDQADYNIAWLYYLRGEYSRAIQMLLTNREDCRKNGDVYQFALCHFDLSEIYLELNLSAEAEEAAREGGRLFHENGNGYEEAKCKANEAIAFGQQGKAFRAIELFADARKMFVKEKNAVWPSLIDLYQAFVLLEEGRLFEARRFCEKAKSFFADSALPGKAVLCDLIIARVSLRSGDLSAAERECRTALDRLQQFESSALSHQAHSLMGQIQREAHEPDAAYASFLNARTALEVLRGNLRGEELKIAFLKNKLAVYEGLVEICLEKSPAASTLEEAFLYIEEAKSRTLTDVLTQRSTMPASAEAGKSELVRRIRSLREELNWYYHRIDIEQLQAEDKSPERVEKLRKEAKTREEDFVRVLREMQATGETALEIPQRVSLQAIRHSLPPETTLLEYFTVGDRVIACLVGKESLEMVGVTLLSRVVQLIRMLQFQISKFRLGRKYVQSLGAPLLQAMRSHLQQLFGELIAPIRARLKGRHLVIVPHGPLHYVPFQALHDGTSDLIDSFTISYAPSATLFSLCQEKPSHPGGGSLVLGAPDEYAPAILDEVRSVSQVLPGANLFVGAEANLDILKSHGPRSRFIHIATHGEFRQDNPAFSSIRLGDARLNLYDLYQLQLPAELVTLSGCATGMNAVAAGDELLGLVRGLLYAGAHTLMLTLWDVHDQTTTEFMTAFYRNLNAGQAKPAALQQAMIEIRDRHPHPYYWAPFFVIGKAF